MRVFNQWCGYVAPARRDVSVGALVSPLSAQKKAPAMVTAGAKSELQGILAQVVWHDIICSVTSNDISCSLPRTVTNYLEALSTF